MLASQTSMQQFKQGWDVVTGGADMLLILSHDLLHKVMDFQLPLFEISSGDMQI